MRGLIIDGFAGAGGASSGIARAMGRDPDYAINHNAEALAVHEANHPGTVHLWGNIWDTNPTKLCAGRPVDVAWFSPDCRHFSRAKGGKKTSARVRSLASSVIPWAREARPRIIFMENVEEWKSWGPLDENGDPVVRKIGLSFRTWHGKIKAQGYKTDMRMLRACDYGAPTNRKRLFFVARRDGLPIVWPRPTHGPGLLPYRTAADCIDWSLPCPSIFEPGRDLVDATLRRVARGVRKFVIDAAEPFVIPVSHSGDDRVQSISEPMRTITASSRSPFALISPSLVHLSNGERPGQAPRTYDINEPLSTVVAGGTKHGLVAAFLAKHYGGHTTPGAQLDLPLSTITTQDHHAVVQVHTEANPDRSEQVWAFLSQYNGTSIGAQLNLPMPTVTTKDRFALVTVRGEQFRIADIGMRMLTPRELANGQGFPRDYIIDRGPNGKTLSKTAQVRCIGNSVCPDVAEALVRANWSAAIADRRVA